MALVCAIVCSFNGAERLEQSLPNIRALTCRPDHLVLVDNGSDDTATATVMSAFETANQWSHVISVDDNFGPANGFATAMFWAVEHDFDYVWLLDDDSMPEADCLRWQLHDVAASGSKVVWPKQVTEFGIVTRYQTWRGALIPRSVVLDAGVPGNRYVWGCEDTEYFQWRIPRLGYECEWSANAELRYTASNNERKRASWHYYYLSRNTLAFRLFEQGNALTMRWKLRRAFVPVAKLAAQIVLKEDRKALKLKRLCQGTSDGLRGRLGLRFPPGKPDRNPTPPSA